VAAPAPPDGRAVAGAFFQRPPRPNGPAGLARQDAPRRLDLVVEVGKAAQAGEAPADIDQGLELPCVDVLAVDGDVPPAREDESCFGLGVVENCLRRPGRIAVYATRDEDGEHAVAAGDRPLDDVAVVGPARDDGDLAGEVSELG